MPTTPLSTNWIPLLGFFTALVASAATTPEASGDAKTGFRFAEVDGRSLGLWEGDKPVLVYNHGVLSRTGVPASFSRSTYVHPLYGLDGEVLSDDFPRDHYHHRGLFWAWPHVGVEGKEYDLWALKGIEQRFARWLEKTADASGAVLGIENGWFVGTKKVVRERVRLRIHAAAENARAVDVECEWTPQDKAVTLTGAADKSYGGLTLRFAPGTNTAITIPSGVTSADLPMTNLPWADLTRLWSHEQVTSGAAIFVHPSHPDFPPQWLTRHYGVLCLGWPGVKPATFAPGQPIRCRYRVWIHRGAVDAVQLKQAYDAYCGSGKK